MHTPSTIGQCPHLHDHPIIHIMHMTYYYYRMIYLEFLLEAGGWGRTPERSIGIGSADPRSGFVPVGE